MILNDRQIRELAQAGMIDPFVEKLEQKNVISYGLTSFGYDMRAGHHWKVFTDLRSTIIDPKNQNNEYYEDFIVDHGQKLLIPPNSYALTHTIETVRIPENVMAICVGKSTYARCGIHVNVTPLEAGWEGQVTVEISNGTRLPVAVYPGEGIMQVMFLQGERPHTTYADRKGKYQGQQGITLARISEE